MGWYDELSRRSARLRGALQDDHEFMNGESPGGLTQGSVGSVHDRNALACPWTSWFRFTIARRLTRHRRAACACGVVALLSQA